MKLMIVSLNLYSEPIKIIDKINTMHLKHRLFNSFLFYFLIVAGLTSVLTKSVTLNQNTYDSAHSNLYLISPTSPPPASVAAVRSPMHRLAVGAMTTAVNKNPVPLSTASKTLGHEAAQTQSDDTKNLSITQNYQKIQLNNKNNGSSSSKTNSATSSSVSTIVPSATGAVIKPVLPSPAAMVAGPSLGQGNSDANLDHNSLDELYKEPMYFGTENSTTITTQIGANAHLPCVIHHIGEGVVSTNERKKKKKMIIIY